MEIIASFWDCDYRFRKRNNKLFLPAENSYAGPGKDLKSLKCGFKNIHEQAEICDKINPHFDEWSFLTGTVFIV